MWFKTAPGVSAITVEQQEFVPAIFVEEDWHNPRTKQTVKVSRGLFRAPDHFANKILDLPDFVAIPTPEGEEDLPQADPLRDGAINQLSGRLAQASVTEQNLRAAIAEITVERDNYRLRVYELEAEIAELNGETPPERPEQEGRKVDDPLGLLTAGLAVKGTLGKE